MGAIVIFVMMGYGPTVIYSISWSIDNTIDYA